MKIGSLALLRSKENSYIEISEERMAVGLQRRRNPPIHTTLTETIPFRSIILQPIPTPRSSQNANSAGDLRVNIDKELAPPRMREGKRIHFDEHVEQCIALEVKNGDDDEPESYAVHDYDDSDSDDGGIMMKRSNSLRKLPPVSNKTISRQSVSTDKKTIAMLLSTTLKREDIPECPPTDSGYGGSLEKRSSSDEGPTSNTSPSLAATSLAILEEGNEGKNVNGTRNSMDEDTRSVVSIDDDVQSQVSSQLNLQERIAEKSLGLLLARNPELGKLAEEALNKVGTARFVNNFRRLLKEFFIDIYPTATSNLEKATVNLFRRRYSRVRLSQQICEVLQPEDSEMGDQLVQQIEGKRKYLEDWISQNPDFYPANPDLSHDAGISDDSEDDFDLESDIKGDTLPLPNVTEMENFLLKGGEGGPLQNLVARLRIFLVPHSLKPLLRTLSSIPTDKIWVDDVQNNTLTNKLKLLMENLTEKKWNWWPLRPPMQALKSGDTRLNWICVSCPQSSI
jgi:hypothetical protein